MSGIVPGMILASESSLRAKTERVAESSPQPARSPRLGNAGAGGNLTPRKRSRPVKTDSELQHAVLAELEREPMVRWCPLPVAKLLWLIKR